MQNFSGIPNETITEMRTRFSASTVPFQSSGKKKDLQFEYRLLHDIVAQYLCAKAGSFDKVTCEKFEVMVAISAGLSVNLGRILFQRLLDMVHNPRKQSQGFTVQISILMELLVRADLGTATKLHVKKVLTSKQVENYIKTNQGTTPTEETASNTEGGTSQQVPPEVSKFLADSTEQNMPNPKKRNHKGVATKTQTKQAATQITTTPPDTTAAKIVENIETVVATNVDPEEDSETDSCPLVHRRCKTKQIVPTEGEGVNADDEQRDHGSQDPTTLDINLSEQGKGKVNLDENLNNDARTEHERQPEPDYIADASESPLHDSIPIIHSMVDIEEQLLECAQTEDITELSERWSLILYKLLETELENLYLAHLANFKTNVVSTHRDFECIAPVNCCCT
ncbi:hypothetical protein F511_41208 [Dorcoceras hygrometricum]|uniref:Uncharacterized protein n=1 Tax=Dorcoceras hygrometricum TaxID=472368 RepID=A0A2Z7C430_9LAMI|nr:hypothetical protein F511_41208 [Dorcoceras hygrometricum]